MRPARVRARTLLLLVGLAALARLLLHVLAMPPYAGLDEAFHVARLAFVRAENRQPSAAEPSVPAFLVGSTQALPGAPPDFALSGAAWPLRARGAPWPDPAVWPDRVRPWTIPNYEAQHPSLYYASLGRIAGFLGVVRQLRELTLFRLASVLFGVFLVLTAAALSARLMGRAGLLAAALLPLFPTWLTLVARASNDALACAFLGLGLFLSARRQTRPAFHILEGLAWAGALAAKLTTWPALVALPLLWWKDARRNLSRIAIVGLFAAAAIGLTLTDLRARTGIALGSQSFAPVSSPPPADAARGPIVWWAWARVFLASAIWTAGQHGNALKPAGMLLFAGVPFSVGFLYLLKGKEPSYLPGKPASRERQALLLGGALLSAFLLGHAVNALGFVRRAMVQGLAMPQGGNEGWYLYSNAAAIVVLLSVALRRGRHYPLLLGALVLWLLAWDLRLHEGGLFRDFAGLTSPAHPTALFRWGPDPARVAGLSRVSATSAAGTPFSALVLLRLVHVAATLALAAAVIRPRLSSMATPRRDATSRGTRGFPRPEPEDPRPGSPSPGRKERSPRAEGR